jgi:nitrite reductase (NO-forming)
VKYIYILISVLLTSCGGAPENEEGEIPVDSKYASGKAIYDAACVVCHMKDGKGLENTFPPLAGSDYLLNNPSRALQQVIYGSSEKMTVNGVVYSGIMPPQEVNDEEAIEVVNYILNAWGNEGGEVSVQDLDEVKKNKN